MSFLNLSEIGYWPLQNSQMCAGDETRDNIYGAFWLRKVTVWQFQGDTCSTALSTGPWMWTKHTQSFPTRMWHPGPTLNTGTSGGWLFREAFSPLVCDLICRVSGRGSERRSAFKVWMSSSVAGGVDQGLGSLEAQALSCQSHYSEADLTRTVGESGLSSRPVLKNEWYKCYSLYDWGKDIKHRKRLQFFIYWALSLRKLWLSAWKTAVPLEFRPVSHDSSGSSGINSNHIDQVDSP